MARPASEPRCDSTSHEPRPPSSACRRTFASRPCDRIRNAFMPARRNLRCLARRCGPPCPTPPVCRSPPPTRVAAVAGENVRLRTAALWHRAATRAGPAGDHSHSSTCPSSSALASSPPVGAERHRVHFVRMSTQRLRATALYATSHSRIWPVLRRRSPATCASPRKASAFTKLGVPAKILARSWPVVPFQSMTRVSSPPVAMIPAVARGRQRPHRMLVSAQGARRSPDSTDQTLATLSRPPRRGACRRH